MPGKTGKSRLKQGQIWPKSLSNKTLERIGLHMRLNGTAPTMHRRYTYFERTVGRMLEPASIEIEGKLHKKLAGPIARKIAKVHKKTGIIIIPKEVEFAPIGFALKRTFRSMAGPGFLGPKTKRRLGEKIKQLYQQGAISFSVEKIAEPRKKHHIKALPRRKKRKKKPAEMQKFDVRASVDFSGALKDIDSILGSRQGKEFRSYFSKYLSEETKEMHRYITEKIGRTIIDERSRLFLKKKGNRGD